MRTALFLLCLLAPGYLQSTARGQLGPLPHPTQLKTDPAVGNLQSIQRYGRQLKTDPDLGEGFSYHVYPLTQQIGVASSSTGSPSDTTPQTATLGTPNRSRQSISDDTLSRINAFDGLLQDWKAAGTISEDMASSLSTARKQASSLTSLRNHVEQIADQGGLDINARNRLLKSLQPSEAAQDLPSRRQDRELLSNTVYQATTDAALGLPPSTAFDWTGGIRNAPPRALPPGRSSGTLTYDPVFQSLSTDNALKSLSFSKATKDGAPGVAEIFHQPLIQIKLRVIEVARQDGLATNSVLNYVSRNANDPSLTSGVPLNAANGGHENVSGLTNFPLSGLFDGLANSTSPGALVNLTSEHINWAASFLATEMNADVVTAPEVVTLNGQNVEFVSGEKLPFALGQNVITGNNNNIQQVFYKHVGTMVSVTPRIVNWGFHGEGRGEATIQASEVPDWGELIDWMTRQDLLPERTGDYVYADYGTGQRIPPFAVKTAVLKELNRYSRNDLIARGINIEWIGGGECLPCRWSPEDCTIDLALVVRLSDPGTTVNDPVAGNTVGSVTKESNVRAVANVIQVKSGHGVVMAGLIGERETDAINKTPVLGDLPIIGAAFRSKAVERVKTEVLIFVEACVLDRDPLNARGQTAAEYRLGAPFVAGELHDNPLECGLQDVGFGTYLPPRSHSECVFWEKHARKVQKIGTHIDDILK